MNKTRFFMGLGALILSAVFTGLAFLPKIGAYFLIASILTELAALAFFASQKRVGRFAALTIANIAAYCLLAFCGLLFVGGLVYMLQ